MNTLLRILRKLFCLSDDSSDQQTYYTSQQMSDTTTKRYVPFSDDTLSAWGSVSQSSYGSCPSVGQGYDARPHYSVNSASPGVRVNIGGLHGYAAGSVASRQSYISTSGLPPLGSMRIPRQRLAANYPNLANVGNYFG